jgi:hypothetical protein
MQAIGFQQDDVQVTVETYADDSSRMIGMLPTFVKIAVDTLHRFCCPTYCCYE